jgi:hypothetical protein
LDKAKSIPTVYDDLDASTVESEPVIVDYHGEEDLNDTKKAASHPWMNNASKLNNASQEEEFNRSGGDETLWDSAQMNTSGHSNGMISGASGSGDGSRDGDEEKEEVDSRDDNDNDNDDGFDAKPAWGEPDFNKEEKTNYTASDRFTPKYVSEQERAAGDNDNDDDLPSVSDEKSLGQTVASSTYGDDRQKVVNQNLLDPYGDKGMYTGVVLRSTGMPHGLGRMIYEEDGRIYEGDWCVFVVLLYICGLWIVV